MGFVTWGRLVLRFALPGGLLVRTLDLWSRGRWFNSWSGHYHVVTTRMVDCLWTGEPFRYMTNIRVNSAFHQLSTRLS